MTKNILQEITQLKTKLNKWGYQYYVLDEPIVADEVYDAALTRLLYLEKKYPAFITIDSPSQRVGGKIIKTLNKITHQYPMLSLANAFNKEDLLKFDNDIKKVTGLDSIEYFVELKIDGLAVSVVYENSLIKYAATRGDGQTGENITENISKIFSIPLKVDNKITNFEIRGEVFLSKKEFVKINEYKKNHNLKLFANPRNAAAGSLRVLNSNISKSRKLEACLYWMSDCQKLNINKQSEIIKYLAKNQAQISPDNKLCLNINDVIVKVKEITKQRDNYPFEIDGVVIKVNDLKIRNIIGATIKHPKWAIAYKLPTEKVETIILDIFATVGRTGKITYNAKLEPTRIAGTIVTATTLHNNEFIKDKDIRINDYVVINKAGDIIPEVLYVIKEKRPLNSKPWKANTHCPNCKQQLVKNEFEVDQFCINSNCQEQQIQALIHFASKKGMDITGLGEQVIRKFFNLKLITSIPDIYLLKYHYPKIIELKNFGSKSISNLLKEIENAKTLGLDRLLFALGIKHIGAKSAKLIAKTFLNFETILKLKDPKVILSIYEIGTKIADSLWNWIKQNDNQQLVYFLISQKQNVSFQQSHILNHNMLTNKTFVITGTFSKNRSFYKDLIEKYGGKVTNTISSKTNYLLVGNNPGSKLTKAQTLSTQIINIDFFTNLKGD